jgi:hypothetical protein
MPLVIDTSPFSPTCNSYASIAKADDYVSTQVADLTVAAAWAALSTDQKSMYLVNATRFLDSSCVYIGDRYSRDQKLDWPRVNAWVQGFLLDVVTFPEKIIEATIEMALFTMGTSGAISVQGQEALQSLQVGPIHLKFNDNSGQPAYRYFPDIVAYLLRDLGTMTNPNVPSAKSIKTVNLIRA